MKRWMGIVGGLLGALLLAGFGTAQTDEECDPRSCASVEHRSEGGSGDRRVGPCKGPATVREIWVVAGDAGPTCVVGDLIVQCDGQVTDRQIIAYIDCPNPEETFRRYCDPASRFESNAGFCELVDYEGNRIRLKVYAPPHVFEAVPYPVGMVAREDAWGVFHPTVKVRWLPPPLWQSSGPYPTYADSGWRVWTWGGSRGPGSVPVFPCDLSESALFEQGVPGGTSCVRLQLWAAPGYGQYLNPLLLPGVLQFPARGMNLALPPGEWVPLNFPYASHPATGEASYVWFGEMKRPAFQGYFQRWWAVRLRVEFKQVKDLTEERERCAPVADADGDGRPDAPGDCWTTIGDPPVIWPGTKQSERVVVRKEWEAEVRDGILDLKRLGHPYSQLHPVRLIIRGPEKVYQAGYVLRSGAPWLWFPVAVREAQSVICADPTCGGYAPP
ncbi:MAG TPA: hypothetical protein VNK89_12565 [Thermoflexus sp.]|nr:hypothetical protein [Thermoflexus sp.]